MSTLLRSSLAAPPVSRALLRGAALPLAASLRQFSSQSYRPAASTTILPPSSPIASGEECAHPLSCLPTASLYRALLLHSVTSSPLLLNMSTKVINSQLNTIERNKPLKWAVDKTFYAQFCGGATPEEIRATIQNFRSLGFAGVILAYAREVEMGDQASLDSAATQINQWLDGTLKTIAYTDPGDFVAIKYTGAGLSVLPLLAAQKKCFEYEQLGAAMIEICEAAKKRGVKLLMDAEQQAVQAGIHGWSKELMSRYNRDGEAVIYNTYQMYLKESPRILVQHASLAREEGWRLGVKLVRGAYLHTDPRHLIHDTKKQTDTAYDAAVRFILTGGRSTAETGDELFAPYVEQCLKPVKAANETCSKIDLLLASHCKPSVRKARELRRKLSNDECNVGVMSYAQLMGMADELSLSLVQPGIKLSEAAVEASQDRVYKYAVWGTTQECLKYLMRRAEENKDAMGRSMENRAAVWEELKRRGLGFKNSAVVAPATPA